MKREFLKSSYTLSTISWKTKQRNRDLSWKAITHTLRRLAQQQGLQPRRPAAQPHSSPHRGLRHAKQTAASEDQVEGSEEIRGTWTHLHPQSCGPSPTEAHSCPQTPPLMPGILRTLGFTPNQVSLDGQSQLGSCTWPKKELPTQRQNCLQKLLGSPKVRVWLTRCWVTEAQTVVARVWSSQLDVSRLSSLLTIQVVRSKKKKKVFALRIHRLQWH